MEATQRRMVKGIVRRDETILRLGGTGDDFHMTWTADDRMFSSLCDGAGWDDPPRHWYNSRLQEIIGGPQDARFEAVEGYPELVNYFDGSWNTTRYYGFGTLALDGTIYQYLSTPNVPFIEPEPRFVGTKLIYSPDTGVTWHNQDGSTPVVWEEWDARSKENMVFFGESQDTFAQLSILQMGRNYEANTDGYVYAYGPNGNVDGTMNELVMFRVKKDRILDRGAYEYFAGLRSDGGADWTQEIEGRGVVHTFPLGWVNKTVHPWGWLPSVVYNAPLGVYMMVNSATGCAPDGSWFGKPSYLGAWVADNPWGPWRQIHEETAWTPGDDAGARTYSPTIAPKWIAEDGQSFWLAWGDFQNTAGPTTDTRAEINELSERTSSFQEWADAMVALRPYYAFNLQRVDLVLE